MSEVLKIVLQLLEPISVSGVEAESLDFGYS